MIVIRIELWPCGSHASRKTIALGTITNVGGTATRGEYEVKLFGAGNGQTEDIEYVYERLAQEPRRVLNNRSPWRTGAVVNFERKRKGAWWLLLYALMDAVGGLRRLA